MDFNTLYSQADRARYEFLKEDLSLCNTFAALVVTESEMGDLAGAWQALVKAEAGYTTIARLVYRLQPNEQEEIRRGLGDLHGKLDGLKQRLAVMG